MKNPILQMLNKTRNTGSNQINSILQAAKGNPTGMFNQLMQTNPQFAEFVKKNKGKRVRSRLGICQKYVEVIYWPVFTI